MATAKTFTIITNRRGVDRETSGTLEELRKYFSYTLIRGESWQHEKGNRKINLNPKSITTLVNNLNNAERNSSMNGHSSTSYRLKDKSAT